MDKPLMECGHTANAVQDGEPVCVICLGFKPGAKVVAADSPDLTGRVARCACGAKTQSRTSLAFFEYMGPEWSIDTFYCGHAGWD